jgi:hypothetical protein
LQPTCGRSKDKVKRKEFSVASLLSKIVTQTAVRVVRSSYSNWLLDRNLVRRITPGSLLFYYGNIHSQAGQDGILSEIFRRIGIRTGRFVEFGALDGVYISNCRFLYEKGWSGVFIEPVPGNFAKLMSHYSDPDIVCIQDKVGAPNSGLGGLTLADLLKRHGVAPETITFTSIDVDGWDLEIFADLGLSPPVIIMEGGFTFSPKLVTKLTDVSQLGDTQQPIQTIWEAARKRGYVPVCFYQDMYLVREDLACDQFLELSPDALYRDAYYFLPADHKERLLEKRAGSKFVQSLETAQFGKFSVDPLGY